jgi:hypothetical protein
MFKNEMGTFLHSLWLRQESDGTVYLCCHILGFYACKEPTKGFSGCIYTLNVLLECPRVPGCAEKVM